MFPDAAITPRSDVPASARRASPPNGVMRTHTACGAGAIDVVRAGTPGRRSDVGLKSEQRVDRSVADLATCRPRSTCATERA
jgi:hypothetical protein